MKKYRKKPVVIEAVQLTSETIIQAYEFIHGPRFSGRAAYSMDEDKWNEYEDIVRKRGMKLKTLESDGETQIASVGDFIIKGIQGEFYPCKPNIFEQTYEEVHEHKHLLK